MIVTVEVGGLDSEKGGNASVFKLDVVDGPCQAGTDTGFKLDHEMNGWDKVSDGFEWLGSVAVSEGELWGVVDERLFTGAA